MDLYVIRHADAGDPSGWPGDDAERPLTALGRRQARALGEAFLRLRITVNAIVASPFTRTWQTAGEFREAAIPDGKEPELCELLAPGAMRRRKLTKLIAAMPGQSIAIVGHDPDLPSYLGWLLDTDPEHVHLEKGGAARVRFEDEPSKGEGVLAWVITPLWYMPAETSEPSAV